MLNTKLFAPAAALLPWSQTQFLPLQYVCLNARRAAPPNPKESGKMSPMLPLWKITYSNSNIMPNQSAFSRQ